MRHISEDTNAPKDGMNETLEFKHILAAWGTLREIGGAGPT